jgi:uncharacterized protein YjbI with pentapeptide repeats
LKNVDLRRADLEHADFSKANLNSANLTGAKMGDGLFIDADMTGTIIDFADTIDAQFKGAIGFKR